MTSILAELRNCSRETDVYKSAGVAVGIATGRRKVQYLCNWRRLSAVCRKVGTVVRARVNHEAEKKSGDHGQGEADKAERPDLQDGSDESSEERIRESKKQTSF